MKNASSNVSVSIGIPAYNEGQNIAALLKALIAQKQTFCTIREIIVVSDGSTDNTVKEAIAVDSTLIKVIERTDRKGQAARQNEILDLFAGDVLVLLNGDILPKQPDFIERLVWPIAANPRVGLVAAKGVPLAPQNLFERIINFSFIMRREVVEKWNGGNNLYTCTGPARAFSRKFAQGFRWPQVVAEDTYSYFAAKEKGFEYVFDPQAEFFFRSPQSFRDHIRQSVRFRQGIKELARHLPNSPVRQAHTIPLRLTVPVLLSFASEHPFLFCGYAAIYTFSAFMSLFTSQANLVWEIADSSKKL